MIIFFSARQKGNKKVPPSVRLKTRASRVSLDIANLDTDLDLV